MLFNMMLNFRSICGFMIGIHNNMFRQFLDGWVDAVQHKLRRKSQVEAQHQGTMESRLQGFVPPSRTSESSCWISRTDLEEETIREVISILKSEFE